MIELTERDLRRRFSRQDDAVFSSRVAFADLVADAAPRPRAGSVRRIVLAVVSLAVVLGAGVAIVALRHPAAPLTPAVTATAPPATTVRLDDAVQLAQRLRTVDQGGGLRPNTATCQPLAASEREALNEFGPTSLPLFKCALTFGNIDVAVTYVAQVLPNGCFIATPAEGKPTTPAIQACGITPAPPVTGMAAVAQQVGASVEITSPGVVSRLSTDEVSGVTVQLATYRGPRDLTCFITLSGKPGAATPQLAEEPVCPSNGDGRKLDARFVRLRPSSAVLLAGTAASEVTGLRIYRGDLSVVYDVPATTIPGTADRHPLLAVIDGASRVDVLVGNDIVAQYGLDGSSFPAPRDTLLGPLPPGRNFAYLLGLARDGSTFKLDADRVEFKTGSDAVAACTARGDTDCAVDYAIVNTEATAEFANVSPTARVVLVDWANCCETTIEISVAEFAKKDRSTLAKPFWVTVDNGVVTRIEEQYLP